MICKILILFNFIPELETWKNNFYFNVFLFLWLQSSSIVNSSGENGAEQKYERKWEAPSFRVVSETKLAAPQHALF